MKSPRLIVMSGLPGTGKSTLAESIARQIKAPILSVDPIESAMLDAGLRRSFATGLAAYLVVRTLAETQLRLGHDAIVDAVNSVRYSKTLWTRLAARYGAELRIIECVCSDEILHAKRLGRRRRGLSAKLREPTWDDVRRRAKEWAPWTRPTFVVDAAQPLAANVRRVSKWLAARG